MLQKRITKLLSNIDALSLRERLLVFAAMLFVIGGAWEALLATPLDQREALVQAKIVSTQARIAELDAAVSTAAHGIGDGMADYRDRLRVLEQQVAAGEESVRIFTTDLIDPTQMRFVLGDLVRQHPGVKLVSAISQPVEPLIAEEAEEPGTTNDDAPKLYRHSLVLELEGGYLDCLAYLESAEGLQWQLYWGSLEIETEEYPLSRITIELHSLSLEPEWIGV
jgi:MSHA biogenesis protein MshJ